MLPCFKTTDTTKLRWPFRQVCIDNEKCTGTRISHNHSFVDSSLLFWESGTVQWPFYQYEHSISQNVSSPASVLSRTNVVLVPQCTSFSSSNLKRGMSDLHLPETMHEPMPVVQQAPDLRYSAYILEKNGDQERFIYPSKQVLGIDPPAPVAEEHLVKRDSTGTAVPQVPGTLTCPGSQGLNETDNNVYSDCTPSLRS